MATFAELPREVHELIIQNVLGADIFVVKLGDFKNLADTSRYWQTLVWKVYWEQYYLEARELSSIRRKERWVKWWKGREIPKDNGAASRDVQMDVEEDLAEDEEAAMAILTDLPTELHRKIVKGMVTVTEQNYTPRIVCLAGISTYWNDLVRDAVGKRVGELWQLDHTELRMRVKGKITIPYDVSQLPPLTFYVRSKKDSAQLEFEAKRVRRLEIVQERIIKL